MLPDILEVAEKHSLIIDPRSLKKREVRAKCPFCGADAVPGKEKKFYLSLNTEDMVFKCWYCGESGGVFRFIALLEGIPESEVIQRYRKPRKRKLHPAERLTSRQMKMIGLSTNIIKAIKGGYNPHLPHSYRFFKRVCEYVWSEWRRFIQTEKYFLFRHLVLSIEDGSYQKAVKYIKEREKEIGAPLLDPLLAVYSMSKWPKWAVETVESGRRLFGTSKGGRRNEKEDSTA